MKDGKEGRKEGRKEGMREGRREGMREGRREGRKGPHFCSQLRGKHRHERYFLLNPKPKPSCPKALDQITP